VSEHDPRKRRISTATAVLLSTAVLLILFCVVLLKERASFRREEPGQRSSAALASTEQEVRMAQCRSEIIGQVKPNALDLKFLAGLHGLCYSRINEEDTLTEFGIRRQAFINQQAETGVLMWMVVVITVSGVLLAAVQLLAGFKLALLGKASFDQGGQFALEANKISVNSSVTGVLVLAISLCFFYIFSKEIYLIKVEGEGSHQPAMKSVTSSFDMKAGWNPDVLSATQVPLSNGKNIVPENPAVTREALKQQRQPAADQTRK
jgi:hypothetical protein